MILNVQVQSMLLQTQPIIFPEMKCLLPYRVSGLAICHVLHELWETEPTFQRLATCGHYAGIWPPIQRWAQKRYRRSEVGNGHRVKNRKGSGNFHNYV
ncbi:MAG: hypothetical protein GY807_04540 [Gammaproteobacteria bacterium]|nr:hypothetical protein [Gammaproteobacteria bacterium]